MIDDLTGVNGASAEIGKKLIKGDPIPYRDSSFDNKTKEEIEGLIEYFTEEEHRFEVGYPITFDNMAYIYLVALFDAFFEDLTETVLIHVPNLLEPTDNREEQIEKEMRRKFRGNITCQTDFWKSKFNIIIESSGIEFTVINLMFEKRHILVHRNGIVDDKFIRKTGSKDYEKGDSIKIEPQYFYRSLDNLQQVADYLTKEIITKFC
jgi:hypothetical protein